MEYNYPAQPVYTASKLFSGFNPVGPAPVDNPTFYKGKVSRGELFSPLDTNSAFHPNATTHTNGLYKTQSSGISQGATEYPPSAAASSSQMTHERFQELTYFDGGIVEPDVSMEFGPRAVDSDGHYPDTSQYHQPPRSDQWPGWEAINPRLAPIPASAIRNSPECSPAMLSNRGVRWGGNRIQPYGNHGQKSPPLRFEGCEIYPGQRNLPFLQPLYSQPQNTPLSTPPSTSSFTLTSPSPYHTSRPINSTVSPSASSDTSSSSSSTLPSPELTVRTPITLHQPRPSRRIPIISLSELALACDDFAASPPTQSFPYQELLSPLTLDFPAKYTSVYSPEHPSLSGETRIEGPRFAHPEQGYPYQSHTEPTYYVGHNSEDVVLCSCGCMESFVISQNNHYPLT
ncbi:hypothetical protein BDZ94DRAFT_1243024 [Collybia nuda]|uniref:Uncharacterized protein n=1 Tax=Collybia nuda TaxID=64659 RepID=A0A9P6CKL8_9AGAR|nr:hypothetical protein BDZ94DRAFT_1243024 [Collybia nuda]